MDQLTLWTNVLATRKIAAEVEATRIAAVEAARIAAEVEATRIAAMIARRDARIAADAVKSASAHRPVEQSPEYKQAERERHEYWMRMIFIDSSGTFRGRRPMSLRLLKPYPQESPSY
jgi:hypothetical protein